MKSSWTSLVDMSLASPEILVNQYSGWVDGWAVVNWVSRLAGVWAWAKQNTIYNDRGQIGTQDGDQ